MRIKEQGTHLTLHEHDDDDDDDDDDEIYERVFPVNPIVDDTSDKLI